MPFVADIDVHGGHVVMYLYRQTPLTNSPDLKLGSRYKRRRIDLEIPKDGNIDDDNNVSVSSGDMESSADSGFLDMEEKCYKFDTIRERAEFTYKEIRRTALEAEKAIAEHENFNSHAKFRYGPKSQWAKEKVEEEAKLSKRGALASARLQRRFAKLPRVIPKARRVLDFDREDGGDRVPTGWSQLSNHELKRIFPSVYDKDRSRARSREESEDRPMENPVPVATSTPDPLDSLAQDIAES